MDVPLTVTQAIEGRDAMAKDLYVNREEEEKRREEERTPVCYVLCVVCNLYVCDVWCAMCGVQCAVCGVMCVVILSMCQACY